VVPAPNVDSSANAQPSIPALALVNLSNDNDRYLPGFVPLTDLETDNGLLWEQAESILVEILVFFFPL
jgi:hypothetical protein